MNTPARSRTCLTLLSGFLVSASLVHPVEASSPRPNILWLTAEDLSPNLGACGDPYAHTPRLDAFARQSVRYTHAFAIAAAGLVRAGDPVPGLAVLERELKNDSRDVALHAARALQLLGDRAEPVRPAIREVLAPARRDEKSVGDPAMYLRFSLEAALEPPEPAPTTNTARLTLERIFSSGEYDSEGAPSLKWLKRGGVYLALEEPADKQAGRDLVRHDLSTGTSQIIAPAHWFVPPGRSNPLSIEDFALSDNGARLLVFTNGRRVWRVNSRGDFWVLDLSSRELRQLGGDVPPASLLFAQFSPDGERVCYVRENNL